METKKDIRFIQSAMSLEVKLKKIHPAATIPVYAKPGDAGLDLVVTRIIDNDLDKVTYAFGIALEIPEGYVGLIFPRSSVKNTSLNLSNAVGVIDSGYRGELMATFRKVYSKYENNHAPIYYVGDKAAQLVILPYPKIQFKEVEDLSSTERGQGGFGSTGK